MRILYTNFHPGNGGGHTTYLSYLFHGLMSSNQKLEVFLAAPKVSKLNQDLKQQYPDRIFDVDFPGKPKELIEALANAKKLKTLIVDQQIDVVHVNGTPDHKVVMLCRWLYRLKFRIVRTKHDSFPIKENWFANKLYGKYTDQMIVVSRYQFEHVITQSLQNKTTVIHNGIDLDYFQPREKSQALLEKFNIQENDLVFVSVAGTALHKGWQFLVEAASGLGEAQRQRIKIVLAGNMPKPEVVDRYIKALNMQDQVIFTGFMDDVREVISIADIGFVLSKHEALSIACREMMAMGKPVLSSNSGGLPENIDHNTNGWIVESESVSQMLEFLQRLKVVELQNFSNSAINRSKATFGIKYFLDQTISVYKEIICN